MPSRRNADLQGHPWDCSNCGDEVEWRSNGYGGRCRPCTLHFGKHKVERPESVIANYRGRLAAIALGLVWCPACKIGKREAEFAKGNSPRGLQKSCRAWQAARRGKAERKRQARYHADLEYQSRRKDQHHRARHKRRAVLQGADAEDISLDYVYKRDGGICQLCKRRVRRADAHIDHIIPIARGGAHVKTNVHLAHASCNQRKWANPANEQLLLVG